jgi:hypothetical protein
MSSIGEGVGEGAGWWMDGARFSVCWGVASVDILGEGGFVETLFASAVVMVLIL